MPKYNEYSIYEANCRDGNCSHNKPHSISDKAESNTGMSTASLRALIWDICFNNPKLRKTLTVDDAYEIQELAIKRAIEMDLIVEQDSKPVESDSKPSDSRIGTNTGHGHVWLRPDGVKYYCAGPGLCWPCSRDADYVAARLGSKD